MPDMKEKLVDVFTHLDRHIQNRDEYGICYTSDFVEAVETVLQMLKNGVTVQDDCKACAEATQNCIVKLQEQIAELRSVQEWISVKDMLPQGADGKSLCENVIAYLNNGEVEAQVCPGWLNGDKWYDEDFCSYGERKTDERTD